MTDLAIAVDDAARFVTVVEAARDEPLTATHKRAALLGWFAPVRVSRRRPHPGEGPDAFSGVH